jgi:hypothetical protein
MVEDIKKEKVTIEKAAVELAKPCLLGYSTPTEQSNCRKA